MENKKVKNAGGNKGKTYFKLAQGEESASIYNLQSGNEKYTLAYDLGWESGNDYASTYDELRHYIKRFYDESGINAKIPSEKEIKKLDVIDPMESF